MKKAAIWGMAALAAGATVGLAVEASGPSGVAAPLAAVPAGDAQWLMFNGTYDAQRFSALEQIDAGNVSGLKEVCRVRVGRAGGFPNGPVVVAGVMYVTVGDATLALDPTDCAVNWKSIYLPEEREPIGGATRGVAFADGHVFRGTGDGRVLALDAASGRELWRVKAAEPTAGEWITAAPIVWKDRIFVGVAGSEFGVRGRMLALDSKNGAPVWQFHTVPGQGEPGVETWKGESWKTGGGGTWSTTTLDPESGEIFVPVGNPAPDLNRDLREGKNLYTNSVVVLNADDGKLKWWYQATPYDDRDLDQAAAPMLFSMRDGTKAMAAASKDGYLRVIARKTHKLIYQLPVTSFLNDKKRVTEQGITTCPGVLGGTQWNGPAYDVREKAIVVGAVDWCSFVQLDKSAGYVRGKGYNGGNMKSVDDPVPSGWITSVDADSGKVRWKFHVPAPVVSAMTPTAGGIVMAGDVSGHFYALRSSDGQVLFRSDTGGGVSGGIVTYTVNHKQYIAITSGNLSRNMWKSPGLPHIIIYSLPEVSADTALAPPDADRGRAIFARACAVCHGASGVGAATGPALKGISVRYSSNSLLDQIRDPKALPGSAQPTMPKL
ncbi:MAG TPA: PQQ-binding-like beta-propeller repeat protein, partial [Steroidobacteraceae bacterium]|nr:PQQ-binding-like beta-propeller repeat protein [Steroidobacteraceae bacterium]